MPGGFRFRYINICISPDFAMKIIAVILLVPTLSLLSFNCFPQQYHTGSAKALKAYKDGMASYDYFEYQSAERFFKQAIDIDNKFYEPHMMLGELMLKQKRYREAAINYRNAVRIDSLFYRPVFFNLANAEMMSGDYENALIHYNVYLEQRNISEKNRLQALKDITKCKFAIEAVKKPVPFSPVSIGDAINTTDDEYWPSITADGQTLMFTRQNNSGAKGSSYLTIQEDFYISYLIDNIWQKAVNAGTPLNTRQNEGAQTLSSDGLYMYFTACDRPGGLGSCDLYFSAYHEGKWSLPVNLGSPVNTPQWESQPSVSADGKIIYFSSSRPGGFGGKDLWYSIKDEKNKWSNPVNLGEVVNTDGDEMSPFIHFDGKTLYFSSDGRPGMGGHDIYMTRAKKDSSWTEPLNLGYPINTYNDEMGLVIESGGQRAYFSSRRDNLTGKDIFYFNLYESVRPEPVAYLKGRVLDKETGKLLKADYELINLSTGKIVISNSTDGSGNFLVCLPSGINYGLNINRPGYLFYSENFMFEGQHTAMAPYLKQIKLSQLKVGEKMLLSNVFFEIDSYELKQESVSELNKLADLLKENSELVVEIGGYTDSTGTDNHNLILSEKRAGSVVNYLIDNGISSNRLMYKGYGNTSPIGDNITLEGRKLNRRTEVQIIENKK